MKKHRTQARKRRAGMKQAATNPVLTSPHSTPPAAGVAAPAEAVDVVWVDEAAAVEDGGRVGIVDIVEIDDPVVVKIGPPGFTEVVDVVAVEVADDPYKLADPVTSWPPPVVEGMEAVVAWRARLEKSVNVSSLPALRFALMEPTIPP